MRTPREILEHAQTIAVVGMSGDLSSEAYRVPASLYWAGFTVIPVNPTRDAVLGFHSYASLENIAQPIDIVDVFRPADEVPDIARQAVSINARALWLQAGISSDEARRIAAEGEVDYIENTCIGVERRRWNIVRTR